jgi:thiamine pyrophosphate-dependent acetolactate synthase large subunit-like protein
MSQANLNRRAVTAQLLARRGDALVVTGLGSTTYDALAAGAHPLIFTLWGGMGAAAMIGLGLAQAQPGRRVIVITGDGEMLMGLGSLATIGAARPANLALIVIDNGLYAETGMQRSHTALGVDLAAMARGAGFAAAQTLHTQPELDAFAATLHGATGPAFTAIKVIPKPTPVTVPPTLDGTTLRARFRDALLGSDQHPLR